jgi:glycogen operon protein
LIDSIPSGADRVVLGSGSPQPLGATLTADGVNFAVHSPTAERIELCLFSEDAATELSRLPLPGRTRDVWHGFLPAPLGGAELVYGYRVHGAYDPARGLLHNPQKLLVDPYARALAGAFTWHDALHAAAEGAELRDSAPFNYKARVVDPVFAWGDDHPPAVPWRDSVLYELHIKGYTRLHPLVPEALRGTYLGLAHPPVIEHLKRLGISAVELLPVQAFVPERAHVARGLTNYWGYNSIAWFAPAPEYAITDAVAEFKTLVKALHAAGIEIILDVVFNHTAEGGADGPILSLKGFDNRGYYRLAADPRQYENHTGCGNTIEIGHPATRKLVIDCLKYWVEDMHVDGFRFDLAPVLGRDDGRFRPDASFFREVRAEPALRYVKLIAEPWDVGPGGYQLGRFPPGWSEWNDRYRDAMRAFWRGDGNSLGQFAERFAGSSDLFRHHGRRPTASINFATCHDGFTLHDLVSYASKHNEANLEGNADGHNHNLSWNNGVEGETQDPRVLDLRERGMRNVLATLLLSYGVPMLQAGDEFARTQRGNNNAYCQDNEISWLDWTLAAARTELVDFVRLLVQLRHRATGLQRDAFLKGARRPGHPLKDVTWVHPSGREMQSGDWGDEARVLGVLIGHAFTDLHGEANAHLLLLCNAGSAPVNFHLPTDEDLSCWQIVFDTAHWREPGRIAGLECGSEYVLESHSTVLLADAAVPASIRTSFAPAKMTT